MSTGRKPQPLSAALTELIALRGWAGGQGDAQLSNVWKTVAGDEVATKTRIKGIKRGVLQIAVFNAPLLSELVSFQQTELLEELQTRHPELKIRRLKFRLQGRM